MPEMPTRLRLRKAENTLTPSVKILKRGRLLNAIFFDQQGINLSWSTATNDRDLYSRQ
jgi:hypothetical protein